MRRSGAPSQLCGNAAKKPRFMPPGPARNDGPPSSGPQPEPSVPSPPPPTPALRNVKTIREKQQKVQRAARLNKRHLYSPPLTSALTCYYSVMWCKASSRKRKRWEGDAVLVARGRTVVLKDMEGRDIGRGLHKASELESLCEGQTLMVGGKQIEVMGIISKQDYTKGRCFQDAAVESPVETVLKAPVYRPVSKSFTRPALKLLLATRPIRACLSGASTHTYTHSPHLACINALKKLCNHPALLYKTLQEKSDELYEGGMMELFPEGYSTGAFSTADSRKLLVLTDLLSAIQNINRSDSPHSSNFLLLLSSKAGGVGLNLIGASHLVLYDIDWNPAMARVWRDGQKKTKIYQRQVSKQGLSGTVVDLSKKAEHISFSAEELRDLFSFDPNTTCLTHNLLDCQCTGDGNTPGFVKEIKEETGRACQLGRNADSTVSFPQRVSMSELMHWRHFSGDVQSYNDIYLNHARNHITYAFQSTTSKSQTTV
uniref:RAD54 homolog B n=1 Tax=Sinocyclocheilus anshuiensis TaxID=1608454 RepID=A0A671M7A3_9TELE